MSFEEGVSPWDDHPVNGGLNKTPNKGVCESHKCALEKLEALATVVQSRASFTRINTDPIYRGSKYKALYMGALYIGLYMPYM